MKIFESALLFLTKKARKYFRNTWVHRLPITSKIYKNLFKLVYGSSDKQIDFRGRPFLLPTKDTSMVPSIINQDYELFELNLYKKLLNKGDTVLDIGANLGIYSIFGAEAVGKTGSVHAFEPVPENIRYLGHNIKLNNYNNITLVKKAVGDKEGSQKIYLSERNVGTHSMGKRNSHKYINVETTTIDRYVKERNLKVNFVKMDVEGYEGHVIRGAKKTLRDSILLTEFTASRIRDCGDEPSEVANILLNTFAHGYIIDERKGELVKITSAKDISLYENGNLLFTNKPIKYA